MPEMKALLIEDPGTIHLTKVPVPELPPGECRVAVRMAGVCRTDLELLKGYMSFRGIPGHEFVGTVIDGSERLAGRRVVGEINAACGHCAACARGMGRHCAERTVLGIYKRPGAFAETLTLPEENLIALPDQISDEEAVFVEPLAAALEIFEQLHIPPASKVLVLGDGKLGLLIAQVCCQRGMRVVLLGRHEKKLAIARRWGAEAAVHNNDATEGLSYASRYPLVVECTGNPVALPPAIALTAPRGTLILKSTYAPADAPNIDWAKIVVDEITVLGSRCGPFAPALRLLAQGKFDVRPLVDHRKTLEQGVEAFALAAQRGVLKVLVSVNAKQA